MEGEQTETDGLVFGGETLLSAPLKYAITAALVAIATLLQWLLWPYLDNAPFILFYPTIILAALYGDGISAIFLSMLIAQFLFVPSESSFKFSYPNDFVKQGIFLISALMIRNLTVVISRGLIKAKKAEAKLATTLESIGDAVMTTDDKGVIVFMNRAAEEMTGWPRRETQGRPLTEIFRIVNKQTGLTAENPVQKVLEAGKTSMLASHTMLITRNGREVPIEDSAAPIRFGEGPEVGGVVLVFRDVTEKYFLKGQETINVQRLQESEDRIRSVINSALDALVGMDDKGFISAWNPQAERTFGFTEQEAMGRRMSETIIPVKFREAHETGMRHYLKSGVGSVLNKRIEITGLRKNGEEFPIELTINPARSESGTHFFAFIRDISDRKKVEADRTKLMEELREAVRARDEFIGIASHELKTPITSLKLQYQMAMRQIKKGDKRVFAEEAVEKRVETSNRQLDRMTALIEEMLDVSRVSTGRLQLSMTVQDLGPLVEEVAERFAEQFEASGPPLGTRIQGEVFASYDRFRIEQVISNLLTNALKFGAGRPVEISLAAEEGFAVIRVIDQGDGIAEENLERIFNRFERAVSANNISGLGLGLYISRQIVEAHHGTISVASMPGKGSSFTVKVPLQARPAQSS